jgi:hypothetical protein
MLMMVDTNDPAFPFVQQANRMEGRRKARNKPRPWFGVFTGVMLAGFALWAWINPALPNSMAFAYLFASLVNGFGAWKAFRAKAAQR